MPRTRVYQSFPEYYFKILDEFAAAPSGEHPLPVKLTKTNADSKRRDLHHFFMSLSKAPISDRFAAEMWKKAKFIQILVSKPDASGLCEVKLVLNRLALAYEGVPQ